MEIFERISGARMHTALYKPYDFDWTVLNRSFFLDVSRFLMRCGRSLSGAVMGLLNNRILKSRLGSVGMISQTKVFNYGISGIIARSAGVRKDLRLGRGSFYGAYWYLSFRTFLGRRGDNLDRFLIRVKETFECFRLVGQAVSVLSTYQYQDVSRQLQTKATLSGSNTAQSPSSGSGIRTQSETTSGISANTPLYAQFFNTLNSKSKFTGMEELIHHFRYFSEGFVSKAGLTYQCVEAPKGELGVMLVSGGSSKPYRMKVRTPVSHNMHLVPSVCAGFVFGDFVMTFCSLDIVLGEIDR